MSKYLQSTSINYSNLQSMTKETIQELVNIRCEIKFVMIWIKADAVKNQNEINSPILPRKKVVVKKVGGGLKQPQNLNIKDHYKINIYFKVLDMIIRHEINA